MKKVYLTLAAAAFLSQANAQFWTSTTYKGAFPVTDGMTGTSSNNWTAGWTNFDPQNVAYGAPTVTVSGNITTNTTWTTGTIVLLSGKVYVKGNSTLTIQPGVIIRGEQSSEGTLIITKGSKIMAQGTQTNPIVFTSDQAVGDRLEGDWGGVILLGKGINNRPGGVANIEGLPTSADTEFGGTDDNDNSGVMSYVRIEFPGIPYAPNVEINGLTLGSVGAGTQIDHIQVSYSGDDSYEWFGGKVDAKYLVAFAGYDDDFDTDFGYRGRVQFGLIVRDKDLSDLAGDSNSFESDNDAAGSNALPRTGAMFSNITVVGPKRDGATTLPAGEKFEKALRIRRNSGISVFNSLFTGWEKGLSIEGASTEDNFSADSSYFRNNVLSNFATGTAKVTATPAYYNTNIFTVADANDTITTIAGINWVSAFPASLNTAPDFRLNTVSTVAAGAAFPTTIFTGGFVGVEEEMANAVSGVAVYPNPSSTNVNVKFDLENAADVTISLVDLTGKVIYSVQNNFVSGTNKTNINVDGLNNGIYFVRVSGENISSTVKFVKN